MAIEFRLRIIHAGFQLLDLRLILLKFSCDFVLPTDDVIDFSPLTFDLSSILHHLGLDLIVRVFECFFLFSQRLSLLPNLDIFYLEDCIASSLVSLHLLESLLDNWVLLIDFRTFIFKLSLLLFEVIDLLLRLRYLSDFPVFGLSYFGIFHV